MNSSSWTWMVAVLLIGMGLQMWITRQELPRLVVPIPSPEVVDPSQASVWQPNTRLQAAQRLGKVLGPETVAVDPHTGHLWAFTLDGWVVRMDPRSEFSHPWVYVGGRPLGGILAHNATKLLLADAQKGLVQVDLASKAIAVLLNYVNGSRIAYADDLEMDLQTGKVYLSDASSLGPPTDRYGRTDTMEGFYDEFLSGQGHGRLIEYDPETRGAKVLLSGLRFANGVAVDRRGEFVLVVESLRVRVLRYWLKGPRQGTSEVFVDHLPGIPDGISSDEHGYFWLALCSKVPRTVPWLLSSVWLRRLVSVLPKAFRPPPQPVGLVAQLDREGHVLQTFQDPTGKQIDFVTAVTVHKNIMYLGSLHYDYVGALKLSPADLNLQAY